MSDPSHDKWMEPKRTGQLLKLVVVSLLELAVLTFIVFVSLPFSILCSKRVAGKKMQAKDYTRMAKCQDCARNGDEYFAVVNRSPSGSEFICCVCSKRFTS